MKTIFNRILRSQGGFTLIELLAVLAIIAVLAGIVTAAVSGTKGASVASQVKSDATAAATGTDNYNTASITGAFPDTDLGTASGLAGVFSAGGGIGVGAVLLNSQGDTIGSLASLTSSADGNLVASRRAINFDAKTDSYGDDGKIRENTFVPDYLASKPSSLVLEGDETSKLGSNTIPEYLWLYVVTSPGGDREARRVEVYQLTNAVCREGNSTLTDSDAAAFALGSPRTATNYSTPADAGDVGSKKTALDTAVAERVTARKDLEKKTETLAKAKIALQKAIDADTGVGSAESTMNTAQVAVDASTVTVVSKVITITAAVTSSVTTTVAGISTTVTTTAAEKIAASATGVLNAKKSAFDVALGNLKTAVANLTASQGFATAAASATDSDACTGTRDVTNLKYKLVY